MGNVFGPSCRDYNVTFVYNIGSGKNPTGSPRNVRDYPLIVFSDYSPAVDEGKRWAKKRRKIVRKWEICRTQNEESIMLCSLRILISGKIGRVSRKKSESTHELYSRPAMPFAFAQRFFSAHIYSQPRWRSRATNENICFILNNVWWL